MFKPVDERTSSAVQLFINDQPVSVPSNYTVAAALLYLGYQQTRLSPVSHQPRAPYCMMGVCYECLVEIDGQGSQQACMREVAEGMRVKLDTADEATEHSV